MRRSHVSPTISPHSKCSEIPTPTLCWGGTYGHLHTAADELNAAGTPVAFAHFRYINPLPANTAEVLARYKKVIVAELNTGMFADFLQCRFPETRIARINKIQGQPFAVSEIVAQTRKIMEEE